MRQPRPTTTPRGIAAALLLAAVAALPPLAPSATLAQGQPTPPPASAPQQQVETPSAQPGAPRRATGATGLPLPRFATLESREVNVRTGPGKDFPIRWVYTRPGLPVRILEEYEAWRLIEDPDGAQGWTHSSLLSTRRTMMVRGGGPQALRRTADDTSRVVLRAEPGVIGDLLNCDRAWCRAEIDGRRGWLPRTALWGVLPDEWQR